MKPQPSGMAWNLLLLTWLVALVSTLSALFIGEVMGQPPCVLCWFQRAFMFPLAVILAIACYRSDFTVWRYALPLTAIGAALAFVQPCMATGPSCSGAGMTLFGVVPLPALALFAFILIAILLIIIRRRTTP